MMTKTAYYMQMAQEAAAQITGSKEQWTAFLTTSARLYKYPFAEQLMIYKQRPEATACAEYDLWNDRMNRYVKRGSKGIALLDMRGEQPRLRYVFDVADTGERKNSRPVQLWKMNAEHEQPIIQALDAAFDVPAGAGSLENHIMEAAERLARDYWEENRRQISDIVADSYLEGYDELNIGASFKRAAAVSIAYSVFTRTVGNADDYFEHEDFLDIFDFNTQAAANVLGTAVSEMSSQIFREIERTIRTYEREKQAERSQNYDGAELHEERRVPDSGHPVVGAGTEAAGQVRENAQSVPAGEQHAAVQSPDPDRETVPAPVGDSGDRDRTDGTDDGGASESESGTGQEIEPDGMGAAHEYAESAGRGSHSDGTYQQLNFMSLFQSEAEQIQKIDAAAKNAAREAESEKPSAFVISEDEIDRMLRAGSNFEGGKIRIYALYQQQGEAKERAAFLKAEYGIGGHSYTFMDGSRGFADYDGKGILLRNYGHDREVRLTWSAVDKRLDRLVENGQYLTALEMEEYRKLEQEYGAPLPMPTAAHVFPPTPPERYDTGNEHVDNMLNTAADIYARSELAAPQRFTVMETDDGYAVWDDIQDGIHVEPDGVSEEFTSEWEAETYRQQLIKKDQEREAKDWLYVEQSKQNLQQDIPFPDVESEEAPESAHAETDPLVLEMQEHARELARESGYAPDERFVVTMTGDNFPDSKDAFAIWDYVKEEYYGYSDGKVQTFADYVSASEALQEIRVRSLEAEKESATVQPEPAAPVQPDYRVGDTLYLDGKAFTIEKVGLFDVELRDPDSVYPIFRSESKENLARLLGHEENVHLYNLVVDLNPGREKQSEEQHLAIPETEPESTHAENYRINSFHLGEGSPKQKFRANMDAIYTLKTLENQNRDATPEEQETLANYVGWGGLADAFDAEKTAWTGEYKELKAALTEEEYAAARASTLNAHYTSPTVIRAIYEALDGMGFEKGNILEPSMGVGNFFGMLPESMVSSQLTGVELDSISGRIARKLYPNADIKITGYENTKFADNSFDVAIGNVPFGDYSLHDKRYDKDHLLIHDYFFVKTLDKVRPGGIVAFVTSKGTLDKANPAARRLMAERADLLGAIRLPNTAFKANAGASVTTDILFLQKRDTPPEQLPAWTETGKNADGMELNNYFLQHPEMILGTMQEVTTQHGKDTACVPDPNVELEDLLSAAVLHLGHENVFQSNTLIEDDVFQSNTQEPPAPETADVFQSNTPMAALRPFSYAVQDGKLMFKEADGNLVPSEMNATAVKRAISMIGIRDAVRNLIEAQRDGCDDEQLHALQADLTQNYDTFVKEFGNIHKRGNKLAFRKDAGYPLLLALEKLDDEQNVIGKTAIFSKRTISPHIVATHADTPEDALGLSLAERGKIDFAYMSALLDGMPQEQITTALRQQIFLDPQTQEWQPADEYLSGNVRAKLDIARLAAQSDPDFAVNVQMLERVQPEPLTAADINVKLGTTWIPPEDIDHFIRDVLHPPFYALNKIKTSYSDAAKLWYVSNKSVDKDPHSLAYTKYGTSRVNAYELLELSLNLRDVQVSDVKIIDGKEKRIPNTKETIKARNAQDALRQAFKDWVFDDPARRERLVGYYNEHFNTTRPREFDGSHLTLPGINPSIQLYSHQKDAVARILYGGNALLAHCVGAGKTWTMAAAAMELRRLGLSHKPMFVVPNSLTEQWGTEFQQLYPGANILVATEADFTKENRKAFCARIATGDYDAVIIGHTQFEKIPLSPENERRHIERQLDTLELSLTDAKRNKDLNFTVKRLESSKKKLETRLEKLMDAKEKDDVVTFEELGVDRLFVDEADEFKNLALFTKMRNVGGINTSAAQKSEDMLAKCEYLNEKTDYHGVCFATGTPVSNSMTELYTMMRYLQNDTLESVNMADFDSWASNFGETVTAMELAPEGTGYRTKTRFAKFCNLPELINLWRQAADIQTADMLDLQRPEVEYHNVKAQPTAAQQAMVQELGKRADRVRSGAVAPYEDNMLAITNDGRKLALDQRLADPSLLDNPGSKLNMVVENVFDTWESSKPTKGTQLIFCDLATPSAAGKDSGRFCAYDDIRDKLIAKGVPADQIAYIHDADTPAKKNALSSKMKSGAIRVLIGSTAKMGAGFNVQERLIALHHVDCPWRPRDVEQRDGRILRQGNTNEKVHIYRYVTEGTFDSYNWQTVENKQKFISQVVTGKSPARTCDDIDDAALSYAEVKALAAGDPEIKERMELDVYVQKLSVLRTAYHNDQYKLEDDVNVNLPHSIVKKENMIAALKRDQATLDANHAQTEGATFRIELNGKTYTAKDKAGEALLTMIADERRKISQNMEGKLSYDDTRSIGSYCGFKLELKRSLMDEVRICIHGATKRMVEPGDNVAGCIQRMNNAMNDIGKFIGDNEQSLARLHEQLDEAKVNLGKPWPLEDEYQQKISRLNELNYKLTRHSSPRKSADLAEPEL